MSKHHLSAHPMRPPKLEHYGSSAGLNQAESTYTGDGEKPLKAEQVSPLAKPVLLSGLGSQVATPSLHHTSPIATPAENPISVKTPVQGDIDSPMPMITRSQSGARVKRSPKVDESPIKSIRSHRVAKRKSPSRRRYHVKPELLTPPNGGSSISFAQQETLDSTIESPTAKTVKFQRIKRSQDAVHKRHNSDSSVECTGEAELDIEQGATNLWSILQTADVADTDDESQAATLEKPPKKTRTDFFSTVLNSPTEPSSSSPVNGPSTITPASSPPKTDPNATDDGDDDDGSATKSPSHQRALSKPKSTRHHSPKPKSPTTPPTRVCKTTGKPFDHNITVRSTPRKRAPPLAEYVSEQITIPTTWEAVTDADKELMSMKEEGKGWDAIRKMWKEKTGQDAAPSTLPNRYNRIKTNLMILSNKETTILLQSVNEVEKAQRAEKWPRVAEIMQGRGGAKYTAEYLQKQFSALH